MNRDRFLPASAAEIRARGWQCPDVVFVSGDAYVDHPSFAAAVLSRLLESHGYKVAILPQPDWKSAEAWRAMGRPRLFYAVSAGNMDSMVNHRTANRKRRNDDAYSPGGRIGLRPDRATQVYAQRCREAFPGVPVVIGGVEASLRRIAHYDYWSDTVRPSMLVSSKADLLVYGLGERPILEIARRIEKGKSLRDMRGVCYLLGKKERAPEGLALPAFETVKRDRKAFAAMTRLHHRETNPFNARRILQRHSDRMLVQNPPSLPLSEQELDAAFDLPYTRLPHPRYGEDLIPAYEMIKDSVTVMRGCFGGCSFCSITLHEGRIVQSRSQRSVLAEVKRIAAQKRFKGTISDLGGPTANMYRMRCTRPAVEAKCRRLSCVHPKICPLLGTSHKPNLELLRQARQVPGVKRVFVASGIRMDLANRDPEYVDAIARHHVGGHLKIAPEHVSERVLALMKKPSRQSCDMFSESFRQASRKAGKEQYLVPYFIASHPGCTTDDMIELAIYLKQRNFRPRQVQDFLPAPMDLATCMYHTGLDPMTMQPVPVARKQKERKTQRALMQYFLPENHALVKEALIARGRTDLIGQGPDCLIPDRPPPPPCNQPPTRAAPTVGYRPGRKGARRGG